MDRVRNYFHFACYNNYWLSLSQAPGWKPEVLEKAKGKKKKAVNKAQKDVPAKTKTTKQHLPSSSQASSSSSSNLQAPASPSTSYPFYSSLLFSLDLSALTEKQVQDLLEDNGMRVSTSFQKNKKTLEFLIERLREEKERYEERKKIERTEQKAGAKENVRGKEKENKKKEQAGDDEDEDVEVELFDLSDDEDEKEDQPVIEDEDDEHDDIDDDEKARREKILKKMKIKVQERYVHYSDSQQMAIIRLHQNKNHRNI